LKYIQTIEIKVFVVLLLISILLILLFHFGNEVNTAFVSDKTGKILAIQYKETSETYDKINEIKITNTYTSYIYPNKLRIETSGVSKIIEIYNGKRYSYYDSINKQYKRGISFSKRLPSVIEKGALLDKIIKSGEYEFFGYEEKDDKKLSIIGVVKETDGHAILNKYWFEKLHNTNLIFKEECFIDNTVVSKTTYIYLKINEVIDKKLFNITAKQ
jgi:hypothetical protein